MSNKNFNGGSNLGASLEKISAMLEKIMAQVEADKQRAIDHYDMLKQSYESMTAHVPMTEEASLEKEMNVALKNINECNKHYTPIVMALTKILSTQIQADAFTKAASSRMNGGNYNSSQIGYESNIDRPIDVHALMNDDDDGIPLKHTDDMPEK